MYRISHGRSGVGSLSSSCLAPHLAPAAQDLCREEKGHTRFLPGSPHCLPDASGGHPSPQCCQVFLKHSCQGPHALLALTPLSGLTRPLPSLVPMDSPLLFTWTIRSRHLGSPQPIFARSRPPGQCLLLLQIPDRASPEPPGRRRCSLSWLLLHRRCQQAARATLSPGSTQGEGVTRVGTLILCC